MLGIPVEIFLPQSSPFAPFPLNAIDIDGHFLAEESGDDAMKTVGDIGHQDYIHVSHDESEHAKKGVGWRAEILGFDARKVEKANALVFAGLGLKQRARRHTVTSCPRWASRGANSTKKASVHCRCLECRARRTRRYEVCGSWSVRSKIPTSTTLIYC